MSISEPLAGAVTPPDGKKRAARRTGRWSPRYVAGHVLPPLLILAVAVGIWEFVSYVILDPSRQFLLPPLETVLHETFLVPENFAELAGALGVTAELAFL